MSSSSLSVAEIREWMRNPDSSIDPFSILQNIVRYQFDEDESQFHELILYALEYRDLFGQYAEILNSLVREIGLFPYLNPDNLGFADRIAYEFHRPVWMGDLDVVFHRSQLFVYRELLSGRSIILSAPTSFGKSLIIDAIVASEKFVNILVVVPTLALIDETRRRLMSQSHSYKIITHLAQRTAERNVYVLTQERAVELTDTGIIDFFVIDEFYKLSLSQDAKGRAVLLNQVLYNLSKQGKQFYMLGPSIESVPENVCEKLGCSFFRKENNTVVSEVHRVSAGKNDYEKLAEVCKQLEGPTIIFCKSPSRVAEVVDNMINYGVEGDSMGVDNAVRWIEREYHSEWHFVKALRKGIGVHHGRIPRALAQYVVRALNSNEIKYLVCTSTLIEGVNTKAKNIVIFDNMIGTQKYDYFTFNNIKGRSGRMFHHFVGHVYLFHDPPMEGLPFVDIPAFTQSENASDELLIQIDYGDLSERSKERLRQYHEQSYLSYNVIKKNIGIDPHQQIEAARMIEQQLKIDAHKVCWKFSPEYEQLKFVCKVIWKAFKGKQLGRNSVVSASQLAYRIHNLQSIPSVSNLIRSQIDYEQNGDADGSVQKILDFLRLWATFHFPRLLRAVNLIQRDVCARYNVDPGDYDYYANQVEFLFLDSAIVALDEYGVPVQLGRKLQSYLRFNGDIDAALESIKELNLYAVNLDAFEYELLSYVKDGL